MGTSTLFDEYRSPVHVLCARVLLAALLLGVIGMASEHWLKRVPTSASTAVAPSRSGSNITLAAPLPEKPPAAKTTASSLSSSSSLPSSPSSSSITFSSSSPKAVWHHLEGDKDVSVGEGGKPSAEGLAVFIWNLGLWKACSNFSRCASLPSSRFPDTYGPVRGVGVIALCMHVLAVLVGLVCSCEDPDNLVGIHVYVPRLEEILALLAGLLMAGTLAMFSQMTEQHPVYHSFRYDWSFWLLVIYVCVLLTAGGVIVLVRLHCAFQERFLRTCICCRTLQTTRSFHSVTLMPVSDIFIHSMKEKSISTQSLQEPFDNASGSKSLDGKSKYGKSDLLAQKTGPASVYRPRDGIPRLSRLSQTSDDDD